MPNRYLTISDDLQIVPNEGWKFLPTSYGLEHAEIKVSAWLEKNANHPRQEEAERWLETAQDQIFLVQEARRLRSMDLAFEPERKRFRRTIRDYFTRRRSNTPTWTRRPMNSPNGSCKNFFMGGSKIDAPAPRSVADRRRARRRKVCVTNWTTTPWNDPRGHLLVRPRIL
jgi:hypothetical protein